jgi:acetyl-CoA acetyltransferase
MRSYAVVVAAAAGLAPDYATDLANGGATPVAMAQHAVMAIEAGLCETVVCVHARTTASRLNLPIRGEIRDGNEDYDEPYGFLGAVANHALMASRHMALYGTTSEQLGAIAVAARRHALVTPNATMRKPMTIEDHQVSRLVVAPLRLFDCSLVSDGGGAFIVTSTERARSMPNVPVQILGMGQHHPHSNLAQAKEVATLGGAISSAKAYRFAGLGPQDMDFAEIYDCFTSNTLITLEDYGFCPKGEGGRWVQGGRIEIGGDLPVNTHGGLLSQAHVEGILHITEAVKQLRRTAEAGRQVEDAEVGIVSGHGGVGSMHGTLVLARAA